MYVCIYYDTRLDKYVSSQIPSQISLSIVCALYFRELVHFLWLVWNTVFIFTAGTYGDPHIRTLDGKLYTFNGYGEYTMMKINTSTVSFELQARTELVSTQNGVTTNATAFSAFAAKDHTGSSIQIEMSQDKKSKVYYIFYLNKEITFYNIFVINDVFSHRFDD